MPLENLTGNAYIDDLNESWPLGSDLPDAGDDHLRGIKNVLKKTFPNVSGPVTLTADEINRGSIPNGSVTVFYQATAPAGWVRVENMTQTFGLRIVASASVGGVGGGTDDPVIMDKVPAHTHGMNFSSGAVSADHTHSFTTSAESADHSHAVSGGTSGGGNHNHIHQAAYHTSILYGSAGGYGTYGGGTPDDGASLLYTSTAGDHSHSFSVQSGGRSAAHTHSGSTGGISTNHSHVVSGTTANNGSAANWTPRYLDMILCRRGT